MSTCSVEGCDRKHLAKTYCGLHYKRFRATGDPTTPTLRDLAPAPEGHRVCTRCAETKPLEGFGASDRNQGGRLRICRSCMNATTAEWVERNPEKAKAAARRSAVKSRYGSEALAGLEHIEAGGGCASCGESRPRMALDHNHETGEYRDVLCMNCNTALGLLFEDPDKITSLLAYALRHQNALEKIDG